MVTSEKTSIIVVIIVPIIK